MAFTYPFFLESPFGGLTLPSGSHTSLFEPLLQAIWEDQLRTNVNKSKTHFININRSKIHLYYPGLDKIRDSINPFRRGEVAAMMPFQLQFRGNEKDLL